MKNIQAMLSAGILMSLASTECNAATEIIECPNALPAVLQAKPAANPPAGWSVHAAPMIPTVHLMRKAAEIRFNHMICKYQVTTTTTYIIELGIAIPTYKTCVKKPGYKFECETDPSYYLR